MPCKRVRNGKTQWIAQVNRKNFRKEQVFASRKDALRWEQEVKELLASEIPPMIVKRLLDAGLTPQSVPDAWENEKTPLVSLHDWATDYLGSIHVSPKTHREKVDCFRSFFRFFAPDAPAIELKPGDALDYLNAVFKTKGGCEANKARKNLLAAWNWGIEYREFPEKNPFKAVKKFPHDTQPHYVPSLEDFLKVLDIATGQDKVILLTFLHTGGRKSEVYNLLWEDVDFNEANPQIRLKTRKTKDGSLDAVWLPMNEELWVALQEHRKSGVDSDWVFTVQQGRYQGRKFGARRTFPKNLCEEAGVRPFGHHGIRGLAGTILALNNVPMKVAQQFLRHKQLSTTERYLRGLKDIRPHLKVLEGGSKIKAA